MLPTFSEDSITLHYQPLVASAGEAVGMEALMRWHHQQRGLISPEAFIPIFEESGLIVPLSRWALSQACSDAASWRHPLTVAVKLSAIQFHRENLPALVESVLTAARLKPERLELEVTHASLLFEPGRTAATMSDLRGDGVKITLTDFDGEKSSLTHLGDFPFSKIKIARSLIAGVETSATARSIVHMIIELVHAKGLSVAAEGIETLGQLDFLQEEGCDWFQGYLLGRPAPIDSHSHITGTAQPAAQTWAGGLDNFTGNARRDASIGQA